MAAEVNVSISVELTGLGLDRTFIDRAIDGITPTAATYNYRVLASTNAEEALDLVHVEYEKLPAVFGIEDALKPGAPDVSGTGTNRISSPPDPGTFPSRQEWGDIEKGFEEADAIVENMVTTGLIYPTFCPPACTLDRTY